MRHSPDSEPGCAPIWALCPSGTAAHSRARPRSRPCPAQVTHPRRSQVANFCRVISRQLRRLTGSRADSEFRVATGTTPVKLPFAHPSPSLPNTPRPAGLPRVPTSPPYPEQRGPAVSPGAMATSRIRACSQRIWTLDSGHWAASARPRTADSALKGRAAPSPRGVLAHRRPRGPLRFRRPRSARCQLRAPCAVSLGPARGPLPQTRRRLPRAPSSSFGNGCTPLSPTLRSDLLALPKTPATPLLRSGAPCVCPPPSRRRGLQSTSTPLSHTPSSFPTASVLGSGPSPRSTRRTHTKLPEPQLGWM